MLEILYLDLPPEHQQPVQQLAKKLDEIKINNEAISIPLLEVPGYSVANIEGIRDLSSMTGEGGNVSNVEVLSETGWLKEVGNVTPSIKGYQPDIQAISQGNLNDVQKLPDAIEQQATRIEGIDELQKQSAVIDNHKVGLDELGDSKNAKEKAVVIVKQKAVDHFAGKQEQLKSAMDKISKYKEKYSSVSSIKDLPKRPPNPMKEKPFIERLTPGVYLQYQQKTYYLLDVNPYVGYKLSGRFTTGVGWNHRFAWDSQYERWNKRSRIFGPRAFVDFKLGKGFVAHVEGESMNSFVPSAIHGNPDNGPREWLWSCMTGIKKEYKIYKNLKGTALIQYNLFNRYYKAPYVDRLNSRIGFEYVLKKKAEKK